jgi:hypothetical protein
LTYIAVAIASTAKCDLDHRPAAGVIFILTEALMARTTRPANGSPDSPKPARPRKGNGSPGALNDPEAVAKRAYEIYQRRGGSHGADLDDCLEAERQLKRGPTDVTGPAPARPRRRKASEETGP